MPTPNRKPSPPRVQQGGIRETMAGTMPIWLLAATVLAYLNALPAAFQFDDYNVIVDNTKLHSLAAWWQHLFTLRPLLKLGYALNWSSGAGAFGFHVVNLALHLANVALLWRLSAHFPRPADWTMRQSRTARLLLLVLFALHPIQTEAVTYISGRSMSQMTFFVLAGLLLWLDSTRRGRAAALLCFLAAVLSKEVALVAPLLLLLFPERDRHRDGLWLAGFLLLATPLLFLAFGYQRLLTEPMARALGINLASELNAVFYLLGQLFRPHALNIDPDLPELRGFSPLLGLQLMLLTSAVAAAWRWRAHRPWFGFGLAWFILALLPTHSLIPRLDLASERHFYLAGIGIFWIVAGVASTWLPARAGFAAPLLLAIAGMGFTAARNADYRDEVSLWLATVELSPGKARAWNNLGYAYRLAGRVPEARAAFNTALLHDPGYRRARANLRQLDTTTLSPP